MDTEQQIRLNFLDEAEEYFDRMESSLLGLADTVIDTEKVDLVLRAAHSIKGGAAMMGFTTLSKVAHRLEDFFKILRVRYVSSQIDTEVETLFLESVDTLRHISDLNRQGMEVTESDINDRTQPTLNRLREHLGDLEAGDENALMAQDEDIDPALLIFEEGVEEILDRFETRLAESNIEELAQELSATAQELVGFGHMADLKPFIQLCESILHHAQSLSQSNIEPLSEQALKAWRRSHALVLRGSIDRLPSALEGISSAELTTAQESFEGSNLEAEFDPADDSTELLDLQTAFDTAEVAGFDPLADDSAELLDLQTAFDTAEVAGFDPADDSTELLDLQTAFDTAEVAEFDPADDSTELLDLQTAFDTAEVAGFDPLADDSAELLDLQTAFDLAEVEAPKAVVQPKAPQLAAIPSPTKKSSVEVDKMVRVPSSQLKQFNNLFEQLILDRNSLNSRLQQLQNIVSLMSQRMSKMEKSNTQLKQWYDRASIEGILSSEPQTSLVGSLAVGSSNVGSAVRRDRFDSLEMDRYTDIHLICQEQIETIVQLQEVATDIELGLQEINQSVRDLHYTTKSMQGNVTRTQMLPFSEAVKRFPRLIRDLNLQFGKQVNLKIIGDRTLLDRSVIEAINDPLMHLFRNSFDHGIEDAATRLAAGKSETGTITIQARNQGTYTIITLSDDGGGISLDKIRARIVQMGIPQEEVHQIPDRELLDFIFEPGFSTASKVTELSGRGVGMDVVKTNLAEIRGDVQVATEAGQGTTFTLRIPFTLSILRVAIVEQGGIVFAIPANSIQEITSFEQEKITTIANMKHFDWDRTKIPLIETDKILIYRRSYNALDFTEEPTINRTMTLVVGDKQFYAALKIDRFWDEQESTIRTIESPIPLPASIVSSVIFGDGKVIPLIDPMALVGEEVIDNYHDDFLSDSPEASSSTRKTILIVDDSINVRRYLSLTLEKAGYLVEQASDGRDAVTKLLGGLQVQGVICDVEMPRLDGYGVLEEIKQRPEFADLPIAMLTSRSNEKHRKLAFNLGASAYFSKPYNEQELLNDLAKIIE